jgi:hypothetical protein
MDWGLGSSPGMSHELQWGGKSGIGATYAQPPTQPYARRRTPSVRLPTIGGLRREVRMMIDDAEDEGWASVTGVSHSMLSGSMPAIATPVSERAQGSDQRLVKRAVYVSPR